MSAAHAIDKMNNAVLYDCALRWEVSSGSEAHDAYVVELDDYAGNGSCICPDFEMRKRPILSRGITCEQAVMRKLVPPLKPGQEVEDALRCKHIIEARRCFTDAVIKSLADAARLSRQ